jgi:hypothetical protein
MNLSDTYTWVATSRMAVLSDDVISKISQKYKYVTPDDIKYISSYLSTYPNKQDLVTEWVAKSVSKGSGRIPEDMTRFVTAANFYFQNVKTDKFKAVVTQENQDKGIQRNPKNILDFTLHDLENIEELFEDPEVDPRANQLGSKLPPGSRIFFNNGTYQIVEVGSPEAACDLARGTKWCTSNNETAAYYLNSNPLYVIYQSGKKIAQLHIGSGVDEIQLMDLRDRDIIPDPAMANVLHESGLLDDILNTLYIQYEDVLENPETAQRWLRFPKEVIETFVSRSPYLSTAYAVNVTGERFPAGEKAISSNADTSLLYATDAIGGRFPLGEKEILNTYNDLFAYMDFLKTSVPDQFQSFMSQYGDLPRVQATLHVLKSGRIRQRT